MPKFVQQMAVSALGVILGILLILAIQWAYHHFSQSRQNEPENVAARVHRTKEFICGYTVNPPLLSKDAETNALSGVLYDYVEAIAKRADFKVLWQEIADISTQNSELLNGKIDGICSGLTTADNKSAENDITTPIYFLPVYAYSRAETKMTGYRYAGLNQKNTKIAIHENSIGADIAEQQFPQANLIIDTDSTLENNAYLPVATLDMVRAGRADIAFADAITAQNYLINNPDKLRQIAGPPLRYLPGGIILNQNEATILSTRINAITQTLELNGRLTKIFMNYDVPEVIRPTLPFTSKKVTYLPPEESDRVTADPNNAN